jgi:transposase InsO family protein
MKNPIYEQIQVRKVKARLRMLQHAQRVSGSVSQTCRFFGVSRSLYYIWKKRFDSKGLAGLRDQTDAEEFYRGRVFHNKKDLARKLKRWEREYNEDRPHLALEGKTPAERVHELAQPSKSVRDLS